MLYPLMQYTDGILVQNRYLLMSTYVVFQGKSGKLVPTRVHGWSWCLLQIRRGNLSVYCMPMARLKCACIDLVTWLYLPYQWHKKQFLNRAAPVGGKKIRRAIDKLSLLTCLERWGAPAPGAPFLRHCMHIIYKRGML